MQTQQYAQKKEKRVLQSCIARSVNLKRAQWITCKYILFEIILYICGLTMCERKVIDAYYIIHAFVLSFEM